MMPPNDNPVLHYLNPQQCIVYLESYHKAGDGIVDAYVDFRLEKDLRLFERVMGGPDLKATVIELLSLKSSKRLRSGCYYNLNLDLLKNYQLVKSDNSLLIGASVNLSQMPIPADDRTELLQRHETLDPEEMSMVNIPQGSIFNLPQVNDLKLFVKDVDQANWNELRNGDDVLVVYDVGARLHATNQEVSTIFNSRINDLKRTKPVLVISHWDMDHIHCLKFLSQQDIKDCFSKIVCPDKLKSLTAKSALKDFRAALGVNNVYCLPLPARTNGVTMHHWKTEGFISLYKGEKSSNINFCGLVMFVTGGQKSANYTGDCRLTQAKDVYEKEKQNIGTNNHVLIAPHHGGDYDASYRYYSRPCDLVIISVGDNNDYGHPKKEMLKYLKSLGTVQMTKDVGDVTVAL